MTTRWPRNPREWGQYAAAMLAVVAWNGAFPRASYLLRWPGRLGPRGLVAYMAWLTALHFWLRQFALPWMRARAEEAEAVKADLRPRLGREPTEAELVEALVEGLGGEARLRLPFVRPLRWWPPAGAGGPRS